MKKYLYPCLIILLLFTGCAQTYELSQNNLATLYDAEPGINPPQFAVLHKSDSISQVFVKFHLPEFQYIAKTGQAPTALIKVFYSLLENYESKIILDSATYILTDSLNYKLDRSMVKTLEIFAKPGEYLVRLVVTDLNRHSSASCFIPLYKDNHFNQQNFLLKNPDDEISFSNILTKTQAFKVYSEQKASGDLFVRYYHRDFPIALPPFATDFNSPFNYAADSTFILQLKDHESQVLTLPGEGFYHFQTDTSHRDGFTLFRFSDDFPKVTAPSEIVEPLRYITTSKEFDLLSNHRSAKLAADSFWLDNCANVNRARGQIAKYYNRVQDANRLFTSYIEGWKTDRGIIYIVFGPPTNVYRGVNTENWVYGEAGHSMSIRFSFVRVNNPFTFNDFNLYRNPLFKEAWYNAVEAWRH